MRTIMAAFIFLVLSIPASSDQLTPDELGAGSELFWQALDEMGLEWDEVRIDLDDMGFYNADKYTPAIVETYFDNPWKASPYSRNITDRLLASSDSLRDVLVQTQSLQQNAVRVGLVEDPLAKYQERVDELGIEALAVAINELAVTPFPVKVIEYEGVPAEVRDAAALFCFCLPDVIELRSAALEPAIKATDLEPEEFFKICLNWAVEPPDEENSDRYTRENVVVMEQLLETVDFDRLNAGATLLAICVQRMVDAVAQVDPEYEYEFGTRTVYGHISLCGLPAKTAEELEREGILLKHAYIPPSKCLLSIETMGNDVYRNQGISYGCGATCRYDQPVSVVIDTTGNDSYLDVKDHWVGGEPDELFPAFGCGILGYGMLVDLEGDDTYQTDYLGIGAGVIGTGIVWDRAGNDTYTGIASVQGSGWFGTGLLIDGGGDDYYECYQYAQGFGYTMGEGLLLDVTGNDRYVAVAGTSEYNFTGPHSDVINLNLAQGFGYGRRDDYGEGHSWGGGIGMLIDGEGDDDYDCGIYALGSSYWLSLGILRDVSGDDNYMSAHYTLAAPPHYSAGVFLDDSGDDVYYGYLRQTLGHGRDWCLGWFEDGGGNDWYQAGHQSLGCGDVNSIGVFWDKGGDDTYLLHGQGFGQTTTSGLSSLRRWQLNLGLFIDGGGFDRYLQVPEEVPFTGDENSLQPFEMCGNGMVWNRGDNMDAPHAYSVGIEAD